MAISVEEFKDHVWDYYRGHGRHDLPWRLDTRPYYILVSEVMLQQTQVSRVITKFVEFTDRFPTLQSLATATNAEALTAWQGLGYNRRGLWLKQAAEIISRDYDGEVPTDTELLVKLPGIGPNTAGSIAAFAFNAPIVFIETNIRRVFIHHFFSDVIARSSSVERGNLSLQIATPACSLAMTEVEGISDADIRPLIEQTLDRENPREWYWALMDYGSQLARTTVNPNRRSKRYALQSKFEGSRRQIRGAVLKMLLVNGQQSIKCLESAITDNRLTSVITELERDGLVIQQGQTVTIKEK